MQKLFLLGSFILASLLLPSTVFAASSIPEISSYTSDTLAIITIIRRVAI